MAALLAIGGVLAVAGFAYHAELAALVLVGFVLKFSLERRWSFDWTSAVLLGAVLLFWYLPAVSSTAFEPYDDQLAYFTFARRFLETGTLIEPFSLRRLATYGGQSLLHATAVMFGSEQNMHLLDAGIGMLILAGLIYGMTRRLSITAASLLIPIPHHNTMSQTTGMILWIALFRTMTLENPHPVLAGLVAAGMCALRTNYVPAVVVAFAIWTLLNRNRWRETLVAGGTCVAAVAPWAILSYRSSGSMLYPLFPGFQRAGFDFTAGVSTAEKLHTLAATFANPSVLLLLIPCVVAAVVAWRGAHVAFACAAIVSSAALAWSLPVSGAATIYRYSQPVALGSMVIAAGVLAHHRRTAIVVTALLAPVLALHVLMTMQQRAAAVAELPGAMTNRQRIFDASVRERYAQLSHAVPNGAGLFAIVPQPSLLDYQRIRIWNADIIGCASPPPGVPFFHGPEQLKRYLLSLGIEYIGFNDFEHPLVETGYWKTWWKEHASYNRVLAPLRPYFLDMLGNVEHLSQTEEIVGRWGDLILVRLRDEAAPPSLPSTPGTASAARMPDANSANVRSE